MATGDTYLKNTDGETLLHTDGATAIHEDCCCGPCTSCTGIPSDDAIISFSGTCSEGWCTSTGAGTYTGSAFADYATFCEWAWSHTEYIGATRYRWILTIRYTKSTGVWSSSLVAQFGENAPGADVSYSNSNVTEVSCNATTGDLEGSFGLGGQNNNFDCTDCQADVVL